MRCELFSLESLRAGDPKAAAERCSPARVPGEMLTHRCWMMSDHLYAALSKELHAKDYAPAVSPAAYAEAHYLPLAYRHLEGRTPKSIWMEGKDEDAAWKLLQELGGGDAIIKDWVKSAKHRWKDACFLPAEVRLERFREIFQAFLGARGMLFEKGVVLRCFHQLFSQGEDLTGQPLHEEYRMFFWKGKLLAATPPTDGTGPFPALLEWEEIAQRFASPFITLDVAREESGGWLIIEAGDAGVSGLPVSISAHDLYTALTARVIP